MILIPPAILEKLIKKHGVSREEVVQCFLNREGPILTDDSEDHVQDPPTLFFISSTDTGRVLKVCFFMDGGDEIIRTTFPPSQPAIRTYEQKK